MGLVAGEATSAKLGKSTMANATPPVVVIQATGEALRANLLIALAAHEATGRIPHVVDDTSTEAREANCSDFVVAALAICTPTHVTIDEAREAHGP